MDSLGNHIHDLVENSVAAMASEVQVMISIRKSGIMEALILDNGCGMADKVTEEVFHPFITSRKSRRQGLGLSLLQQNSLRCGGSVALKSQLNQGTELSFTWDLKHVDCLPLGDLAGVYQALITTIPDTEFIFNLTAEQHVTVWNSKEIKDAIYPLSLVDQSIRQGIRSMLQTEFEAFKSCFKKKNRILNLN